MNLKKVVPLVAAVVLGLLAAEMVVKMAQGTKGSISSKQLDTTKVVVIKQDVTAGQELTPDDLEIGELSAGTPTSGAAFHDPAELIGRVTTIPLIAGQAVTEALLAPKGSGSGLQAIVPKGMRAITVEINEFSGVAFFLTPGCKVDILHTMRDETGGSVTKTIVQNVIVTAVGTKPNPDQGAQQAHSVTLLVTPHQAEAIALAAANGRPVFALRNSGDAQATDTTGVSLAQLMGNGKDAAPTPVSLPTTNPTGAPVQDVFDPGAAPKHQTPQIWSMRVISGGESTLVNVKLPHSQGDTAITGGQNEAN